jgi:hypothetical protein
LETVIETQLEVKRKASEKPSKKKFVVDKIDAIAADLQKLTRRGAFLLKDAMIEVFIRKLQNFYLLY